MVYSPGLSAADRRQIAAILWGMVWGILAGYFALIYLIPPVVFGFPVVAFAVCPLISNIPVCSWSRAGRRAQDGAAGAASGMAGPGSTT
jgi:hypothetical protein